MAFQNGYLGSPSAKGSWQGKKMHMCSIFLSRGTQQVTLQPKNNPAHLPKLSTSWNRSDQTPRTLPCLAAAPVERYVCCCLLRLSAVQGRLLPFQHAALPRTPALLLPSCPGKGAGITFTPSEEGTVQPSCHPSEVLYNTVSLPSLSFVFLQSRWWEVT